MVTVLNIRGFADRLVSPTNLVFGSHRIYVEEAQVNPHSKDMQRCCKRMLRHNFLTNDIQAYDFHEGVINFSKESAKSTLYFADTHSVANEAFLRIFRVNGATFEEGAATLLPIEQGLEEQEYISYLSSSGLYGIDDRYALVEIPSVKHGSSYVLLDADEQTFYKLPELLGQSEALLGFEAVSILEIEQKPFILFKTGQMNFSHIEAAGFLQEAPLHMSEGLLVLEASSFVDFVKYGVPLPANSLIDSCDERSGFVSYHLYSHMLVYYKNHFHERTTTVVSYNLLTHSKLETKLSGIHHEIFYANGEYFLCSSAPECLEYRQTRNNKTLLRTSSQERSLYGNHDYLITYSWLEGFDRKVYVHDLRRNCTSFAGQGSVCFDASREILTIFSTQPAIS